MIQQIRKALQKAQACGVPIGTRTFGVQRQDGVFVVDPAVSCVCAIGAVLLGEVCKDMHESIQAAEILGISQDDIWSIACAFDGHPPRDKIARVGAKLRKEFLLCE